MPEPDPNRGYVDPLAEDAFGVRPRRRLEPQEDVLPESQEFFHADEDGTVEARERGAFDAHPGEEEAFASGEPDWASSQERGGSGPVEGVEPEPRHQRIFVPRWESQTTSAEPQTAFAEPQTAFAEPQTRAASGSKTWSVPNAQAWRMVPTHGHGAWLPIATATALVLAVGALIWAVLLQHRLSDTEEKLQIAERGSTVFSRRLAEADAKIRANSENVDQQLSAAEKQQEELAARAAALASQQRTDASRLEASQATTAKQLGAVRTEVTSVKSSVTSVRTDVAATKTEVAATKTDLADTKQLLQRTVGDAGVLSGLIARNHDELEMLKHRGERSYYEFTLRKGADPLRLSSARIQIQLKKMNEKKGRYTLTVNSDDRSIEKKDKTLLEPVQFYSGRTPQLVEIVVNSMGKDVVGGYLSVPRGL